MRVIHSVTTIISTYASAKLWANYAQTIGKLHYMVAGRVGYDNMYRVGNMRNGMFADNSAGKSKDANFLTGGVKSNATVTLGGGNALSLGWL